MVLGLLRNIPILNSFVNKKENPDQKTETEATANIKNEEALIKEGLKPLFIVALPEGDFSELKAKLKEKFSGRDLRFMVDPELKKPKLYIIKESALNKRNSETSLDQDFIKKNYEVVELNAAGERLGESLLRTMNTKLSYLKGAEQKIEYTQKGAEKAKLRESLEKLSKIGVHIHDDNCGCGETHGGGTGDGEINFSKTKTHTTGFSINTERSKSLIDFFTSLRTSTETNHNEFIKKSNEVYIIHDPRKNSDEELDWRECKLTIAQKKAAINGLPSFNIYEMKLGDFLEGKALPSQSGTMRIYQVHNESHVGFKAAPSLSILTHLTNLTKEHLNTAVQEEFQNDLNNTCREINEHVEKNTSRKTTLNFGTSIITADALVNEGRFKGQIQNLLNIISSPKSQENFQNLDSQSANNYRDTRIKIAAQPNVDKLLGDSITDKNNLEEKIKKEGLLAQLEQSDPISQKINRELARRDDFKNSKDPKTGKEEHDKQIDRIALTGQFSFIDRQKFHEDNKTYKDFPALPESWKTEPNSPKPNTQETETNHTRTPQATAQEPIETNPVATNHQSELVEEEKQERENTTPL